MKISLRAAILLLGLASLTACGDSPEEARQKLADLGVDYSEQSFVEHASEGDGMVVDLFLVAGMSPDKPETRAAVQGAMEGGHAEVARRLLDEGASLDADSEGSARALVGAAKNGSAEVVQMILEAGANPEVGADVSFRIESVIDRALIEEIGRDRIEREIGKTVTFESAPPVAVAAIEGEAEIVRLLLEAGAEVNPVAASDEGPKASALMWATQNGHAETVRALLEGGADPNHVGPDGQFPVLVAAAMRGHSEVIEALLEGGADPNARETEAEMTALMAAAWGFQEFSLGVSAADREATVRALLDGGADPTLESEGGVSPLELASNESALEALNEEDGNTEVARMLREAAPD